MQCCQFSILAHIQALQLIAVAVQICQCCEILHAGQVGDFHTIHINGSYCRYFFCDQNAVTVGVAVFLHIAAEICVRERGFVHFHHGSADGTADGIRTVLAVNIIGIGHCVICKHQIAFRDHSPRQVGNHFLLDAVIRKANAERLRCEGDQIITIEADVF